MSDITGSVLDWEKMEFPRSPMGDFGGNRGRPSVYAMPVLGFQAGRKKPIKNAVLSIVPLV